MDKLDIFYVPRNFFNFNFLTPSNLAVGFMAFFCLASISSRMDDIKKIEANDRENEKKHHERLRIMQKNHDITMEQLSDLKEKTDECEAVTNNVVMGFCELKDQQDIVNTELNSLVDISHTSYLEFLDCKDRELAAAVKGLSDDISSKVSVSQQKNEEIVGQLNIAQKKAKDAFLKFSQLQKDISAKIANIENCLNRGTTPVKTESRGNLNRYNNAPSGAYLSSFFDK